MEKKTLLQKITQTLLAAFYVALTLGVPLPAKAADSPYAPYAFLIGKWDVAAQAGAPPAATAEFRWGPKHSYMLYTGNLIIGGEEKPHFEGMLAWNGVHKNMDMLVELDLETGLADESGTVSIGSDGTVTRDITAAYSEGTRPMGSPTAGPDGLSVHFRQTFKSIGRDTVITTVMRDTGNGFVPTFPGSDHLIMTRRP